MRFVKESFFVILIYKNFIVKSIYLILNLSRKARYIQKYFFKNNKNKTQHNFKI